MKTFKKSLFYLSITIGVLVILVSLLSLIHDLTYWYYKILDFPRLQYLILALFSLLLFLALNRKWKLGSILLVSGLVVSIYIQAARILPYYVGEKTVPDAEEGDVSSRNKVGVLIANVLITNRQAEDFLEIVKNTDPDMILVMEVDQWWVEQLEVLEDEYQYVMKYPLDNAYGMALYSRLPLRDEKIKFLNHPDVPSFHAETVLPSGASFDFHGVHPVAPVPSEKYPDNVGEGEVALLKTGRLVAESPLPSVVAGDYNDVSWSHTSGLFVSKANLNNVRLGRGLYNSFDAKSFIMRWPLDHFFVTEGFSILELKRLPGFNSDHFPMYAELVLENEMKK